MPLAVTPPATLMQDCLETQTEVDIALQMLEQGASVIPTITNGDLVRKIRALRVDLKVCNADKLALRGWKADLAD